MAHDPTFKDDEGRPLKTVTIHIGEYYASRETAVITTFLGSCVAACLFDGTHRIGGMNHILVPGRASFRDFNAPARYSINAMELLINAMLTLGAEKRKIQAKVFGGANVIPGLTEGQAVGAKISEFVLEFLACEGIPVAARDLGGYKSRKIFFHTDTGVVYVRRSHSMKSNQMALMERASLNRLKDIVSKPSDVVLFDPSD
ncbi:chemoreceptor glutamine deamidase CheD [Desulfatiferula olefinivorans]